MINMYLTSAGMSSAIFFVIHFVSMSCGQFYLQLACKFANKILSRRGVENSKSPPFSQHAFLSVKRSILAANSANPPYNPT